MDKNAADEQDRAKLIANLNRQYTELADLEPLLKRDPQVLAAYKMAIERLNKQLPETTSIQQMKGYWEAMSDVLGSRRRLDRELMRSANMAL